MTTTGQEPTPEPQAGEGEPEQEQPNSGKQQMTLEEALPALELARKQAADYRRRMRDVEARLTEAEKAQAAAAEQQAAEQGRFQELYESEKKTRADLEARLRQIEYDGLRKDAAHAAGIPQLWERLQGQTAEDLAEDARALAAMMQPVNGQPQRQATTPPTPQPQAAGKLTDDERRARAAKTF